MKCPKARTLMRRMAAAGVVTLTTGFAVSNLCAEPWKFGVMADTQWTYPSDGANPNSVAVSIINQLNPQFIDAGVKFVVQVGDITDNGSTAAITTHAVARQPLYNAGIGFFPLRGNHESSQTAARQLTNDFPQTQGLGSNVFGTTGFNSPDPAGNGNLQGLSYAFDYQNARFVLLDQFTRLSGTSPSVNDAIVDQVPWVDATVSGRPAGTHAFVFNHKNLIGQNHTDVMFGGNPTSNPDAQNAFIGSMSSNAVGYVMSGHDHVHQRSLITSPDGLFMARQLICGSDSSKFYTPTKPSRDQAYNNPPRELSLAQDLYRIGYYIFTVDGPQVTVDYYASDEYFPSGNSPSVTPTLHFRKRETFGYSLNGQEFIVSQGQSYTVMQDSTAAGSGFVGTSAQILGGTNGSRVLDGSDRPVTKCLSTGWAARPIEAASDVLTLLGLAEVAAGQTDTYTLSLSYDGTGLSMADLESSAFALCTPNAFGRWIRAVDANVGGTASFVLGPWNAGYTLGTYGVDTNAGTVWAVLNHAGTFAAALTRIPEPGYIAGDWHQHSTYTDGSYTHGAVSASNAFFGLDWWAKSEHGGKFNRNGSVSGLDTGNTVYWDQMPGVTILGDVSVSGGHTNMWRWQSIRDYEFYDTLTARGIYTNKTIIQGLEWNVPGHEHCSMATITDEFGTSPNAALVAQFEYQFDNSDTDTTGGAAQGWVKSSLSGHAKAVEGVAWLQTYLPTTSWLTPAHPERYIYNGSTGWNVEHFRDMNNAGPDVFFGFESMPGHQKAADRGEYRGSRPSVGTNTYGGCGYFSAKVGGLWDALLGEGRQFWLFASSDFHATGADFWPGEYQKTYSYVADKNLADSSEAAQQIVDSLRSGRAWVVEGDLIDHLEFTAAGAVMGSKVVVTSNTVTLDITVHDPEGTNHGPAGHNTPTLDHVDVIAGEFGGFIAPEDPAYTNDVNSTTRVVARFDAAGGETDTAGITSTAWTDLGGGWKHMSLTFDTLGKSTYFRLRGSNLGLGDADETDGAGHPLDDGLLAPNDTAKAFDDLWFYSNPVFVQVNQAPLVALTSPTNNARFTEGYSISLAASASDDGSLTSVSFYADDNLLVTDTSSPYQYYWAGAALGTHLLQAVALDDTGVSTTSAVVTVTVEAPANTVDLSKALSFRVAASTDDAEENMANGAMDIESSDLEIIQDGSKIQRLGMRFTGVNIPKGARVLYAHLQFTCDEIGGKNINPFNVTLFGEAADTATAYDAAASNLTSRASTTATVNWSTAPNWETVGEAGPAQRTPNLASIVQEIVDRPGWAEGNPIAIMIEGQGSRCAEAFDGEPTMAPELVVVAVREATFSVADNNDDAEEDLYDGGMYLDSSDLELILDGSTVQAVGVRFHSVSLPEDAELVDAYIQFTCDEIGGKNVNPFNVTIRAENADHPAIYTSATSNITSRATTTASVLWSGVPAWQIVGEAGLAQRTPSLVELVKEVMARPGWQNGNAMAFRLEGEGSRCAEAYESGAATAPKLVLLYEGAPQPPVLSITESNGNMVITWPVQWAEGYRLEFSPALMSTNWVPVSSQGYFRLVK